MSEKKYINLTDEEIEALPVSRQRKWQLRNPELNKTMKDRWSKSETGRESKRRSNRKQAAKRKGQL